MRRSWLNAREVTLTPMGVYRRISSAASMRWRMSATSSESLLQGVEVEDVASGDVHRVGLIRERDG
jgi:hypothetical protein